MARMRGFAQNLQESTSEVPGGALALLIYGLFLDGLGLISLLPGSWVPLAKEKLILTHPEIAHN